MILCACGCGTELPPGYKWKNLRGHAKGKKKSPRSKGNGHARPEPVEDGPYSIEVSVHGSRFAEIFAGATEQEQAVAIQTILQGRIDTILGAE